MADLMMQYGVCIILCASGLFFVIMTYGAHFAGRSGVPFIGGFLIALGFLTSPFKWLALTGLIDPGYWSVPCFMILDHIRGKRFETFFAEQDYAVQAADDTKRLRIWIPQRNEEIVRHYATRHIYELRVPKLLFAVCTDKDGKRFMVYDKSDRGCGIEASEFDGDRFVFTGLKYKNSDMTVEIEMIRHEK